ncbi:hypothetical protein [Pyrobaculum islandicum]|nr:hypothetical protein [Pyrobaculum islandicum]
MKLAEYGIWQYVVDKNDTSKTLICNEIHRNGGVLRETPQAIQ